MGTGNGIRNLLRFDEGYSEYELLERETGSPSYLEGWNDVCAQGETSKEEIPASADETAKRLAEVFRSDINNDIILRRFTIGQGKICLIAYMNGMADDTKVNDFILRPLMQGSVPQSENIGIKYLIQNFIQISEVKTEKDLSIARLGIMDGLTALFVDGENMCAMLETHGYEKRSIGTTENEKVVRGPKEGFTESLRTNITLVRRILHTDDLVVETRLAGGDNNIRIAIVYRDGITNRTLIDEVKQRLAKINIRTITSSGTLEQLIEDNKWSPIPQTLSTERPDRACSHIMQGRVCLIVEGSPFALLMPITFSTLLNSPEDIYMRKPLGTVLRVVRYVGAFLSIILPGYFLSLALYHQGLLSTEVLSTVIASREMVFEPIATEIILLLLVFQLIREAGMRVPGSIGQAIGIIGGLILGQAAVAANLASSVVLIVVALSGLGNFCIPDYSTQIAASYFRIALVIAAWLGGLLGMAAAIMLMVCYLASMKSFGVPFLAPFSPKTYSKRPLIIRGSIGMHHRADDFVNAHCDTLEKEKSST